ncbi:sensor histidine kinase [Sphingomonas canadensis]|uniref:histidine kinase n=1 Tax=Sphingomonas canadensis TaxID=1219257 RepID=A0ABW3H764_9SPHN|nr:HAMP domain-containing sensor histidine kinase [Sphingomonas canadensis]MCW3836873.1 HAMP domain-containing histidine kinase [Sphingomonas canadensis]
MRFDDTLETVLAGDLGTPYGMQSAWRQLVDLIGRGRALPDPRALNILRGIREKVPLAVRAASARGLEFANPPPALVRLLAVDEVKVAVPVLRSARLSTADWVQLLPELSPAGRAVLRNRRDLSPVVRRALESFGPIDFILPDESVPDVPEVPVEPEIAAAVAPEQGGEGWTEAAVTPDSAPEPVVVSEAEPEIAEAAPVPEALVPPAAIEAEAAPLEVEPPIAATDAVVAVPAESPAGTVASEEARHPAAEVAAPAADPAPPPPPAEADLARANLAGAGVFAGAAWLAPVDAAVEEVAPVAEVPAAPVTVTPPPVPVAPIFTAPAPAPVVEAPKGPPEQMVDWTQVLATPTAAAAPVPAPEHAAMPAPQPEAASMPPEPLHPQEAAAPAVPAGGESSVLVEAVVEEEDFSFVSLARVAAAIPISAIVAAPEPMPVQSGTTGATSRSEPIAQPAEAAQEAPMATIDTIFADAPEAAAAPHADTHASAAPGDEAQEGPFQIAEVVARIDAFWRDREAAQIRGDGGVRAVPVADSFRFETDAKGVIRWVEGVSRAPLVGLSLEGVPGGAGSQVDGVASGAFRRRAGFSNARLLIDGESDASGAWLMSAIPVFDPANGRFTGYRGTARRPRADERAEPVRAAAARATPADSLRQLVHELRTPTNAIAGFAEMIETQMLGPVADPYRDRATVIRSQAKELLGAIDDLDLAARLDSSALSLVPGRVALRPLLAGIADDLAQLAALRGSCIALPVDDLAVNGDRRAVERLLSRLMATLVSASTMGERIGVRTATEGEAVLITIDRPQALSDYPGDKVLGIDDEDGDTSLLGAGFALRLARNLARELGGGLVIGPESLTLRLPAFENKPVGQAHLS